MRLVFNVTYKYVGKKYIIIVVGTMFILYPFCVCVCVCVCVCRVLKKHSFLECYDYYSTTARSHAARLDGQAIIVSSTVSSIKGREHGAKNLIKTPYYNYYS